MSIADDKFHEFIDQVGECAPGSDFAVRYFFQDELNAFLIGLLCSNIRGCKRHAGAGTLWDFTFQDDSILRFEDVLQEDGPCRVRVVEKPETPWNNPLF